MKTPDDPTTSLTELEHEAFDWVVRFVSGEARPEDIKALQEWAAQSPAHAAAFGRARDVWRATGPVTRKLSAAGTSLIRQKAGAGNMGRTSLGRRAVLGGAVAASATGAAFMMVRPPMGLWPSWSELAADYRTQTGQQRQIVLSGDVSIDMNTQTSIALRSAENARGNIELIAGEAMISAPPGPFTVVAAGGRVIAADARFNLRRDGHLVCVTCVSGEVRVECRPMQIQLPAGKQVAYSDQGLGAPTAIDPAAVTAWQQGIVIFDATPIATVVEEVNRYRSGRVILTNAALGRERFSARFQIASIGEVVGQIAQVFSVRVTTLPGGIELLG